MSWPTGGGTARWKGRNPKAYAMQLIIDTNPDIYKNMHVEPMPGIEFLKRVEAVQNNIETPAEYVHVD